MRCKKLRTSVLSKSRTGENHSWKIAYSTEIWFLDRVVTWQNLFAATLRAKFTLFNCGVLVGCGWHKQTKAWQNGSLKPLTHSNFSCQNRPMYVPTKNSGLDYDQRLSDDLNFFKKNNVGLQGKLCPACACPRLHPLPIHQALLQGAHFWKKQ